MKKIPRDQSLRRKTFLVQLFGSRELLLNLALREIRGQYKRTILGQLWSLANPIAAMIVYTIVFGFILQVNPPSGNPSGINIFGVWLLCGLLPWTFFSTTLQRAIGSLVLNSGLIQKVYFPRFVLPISVVLSVGYNWLFEMALLFIVLLFLGVTPFPWMLGTLGIMFLLAFFATGLSLMLAIANVHFRDTQYLATVLLQIWMYLTPVVYPLTLVEVQSDKFGELFGTNISILDLYQINPLARFVEVFRNLLYDNASPNTNDVLYLAAASAVSLIVGILIFQRAEKGLAEIL